MTRTYSLSNYDSNIYRRQTIFRQSVTNNNTSSPAPGQLFLKRPGSYRLSFHNGRVGSGSSTRGSGFKKNGNYIFEKIKDEEIEMKNGFISPENTPRSIRYCSD